MLFLLFIYLFIAAWYVVIFGIFGVFTFPFRLVRRGHRKQEHLQREQLATMQALLAQQQQQQQHACSRHAAVGVQRRRLV